MERISFRVKFLKVEITLRDSACQLAGKARTCLVKTFFSGSGRTWKSSVRCPFKAILLAKWIKTLSLLNWWISKIVALWLMIATDQQPRPEISFALNWTTCFFYNPVTVENNYNCLNLFSFWYGPVSGTSLFPGCTKSNILKYCWWPIYESFYYVEPQFLKQLLLDACGSAAEAVVLAEFLNRLNMAYVPSSDSNLKYNLPRIFIAMICELPSSKLCSFMESN